MLSDILDEHRRYLADPVRLAAYERAIHESVTPGDVVLDLGAGTGILGLFACRAGAKRVYAIDRGEIVELTREICRANGYLDRVVFIQGLSTQVELPEKVDVIVADQVGFLGVEAGLCEFFNDARERFLKPNRIMIPSRLELFVAPVEYPQLRDQINFWDSPIAGFNMQPVRSRATNSNHLVRLSPDQLLSAPACLAALDLSKETPPTLRLTASTTIQRAGSLDGIGGWCSAGLSKTTAMTNAPLSEQSINRENAFFPIEESVALVPGDVVQITLRYSLHDAIISWIVEVWENDSHADAHIKDEEQRTKKARFAHSTFSSMFISQETLSRTASDFVPKLSLQGEAQHFVLSLCDGQQSLSTIEHGVSERYPQLFRSSREVAEFVAKITTRYA